MKKLSILLVLIIFSRLAYAVCDTSIINITSSATMFCANDSVRICAPEGYASYYWNNLSSTPCFYTQISGNYYVTVTDDSGCVHYSNHLSAVAYDMQSIGISLNTDTLVAYTGGGGTIQWNLNDHPIPGATAEMYIAIQSGYYTLTVVDSNGCSRTSLPDYVIGSGDPQPFSVSLNHTTQACIGSKLALRVVSFTNGTPPYSYLWSGTGSPLECTACEFPTVTFNENSQYSVTVTDANHQTATATIYYTTAPANSLPQIIFTSTNISCAGGDTTLLNVTGNFLTYDINWGDGSDYVLANHVAYFYAQPGIYPISATDDNHCINTVFDTILNTGINISATEQVNPVCIGDNTGKLVVAASNGTAPFGYLWSTGTTTDSIVNIASGSYTVTVTDITNCSFAQTFFIPNTNWFFYTYLLESDANCGSTGAINTEVAGGVAPYTYLWSNSDTTQNANQLSQGYYWVTVTDSLGCHTTGSAYVNSSCSSYISGTAFVDLNNNCVFDNDEASASNVYFTATNTLGQSYYGYTTYDGTYSIAVDMQGVYTLTANAFSNTDGCATATLCGNNNQTVTIANLGDVVNNNNYAITISSGFDLTVHPGWTSANPGFQKEYWLFPYNQSYTVYNGPATVVFKYDSNLIYDYSNPPLPAVDLNAHTLTWVIDTAPNLYYDWDYMLLDNYFTVPVDLDLGYLLQNDFYITPTEGDCDSANNHLHFTEIVTGSHDPNEKDVSPAGQITEKDSVLTYSIHFQNTGTDSTWFVVVLDTLPPQLNPATVKNLASSNKYSEFSISGKGILKWVFNPLRLPDSISNPMGSKGFVTFSVKRMGNLPLGTAISNTASIYFDYNQPVQTNAAIDTVSRFSAITEITASGISVTAFPNPFADVTNIVVSGINEKYNFQLFDVTGQLVKEITGITQNQFKLNRSELSAAISFYRLVVDSKPVAYGKLVAE